MESARHACLALVTVTPPCGRAAQLECIRRIMNVYLTLELRGAEHVRLVAPRLAIPLSFKLEA